MSYHLKISKPKFISSFILIFISLNFVSGFFFTIVNNFDNGNIEIRDNFLSSTQINSGHPTAYAIILGVDDYPPGYNDLSYCVDDMQEIRKVLVNEMGYLPENIYSLYNITATSQNLDNIFSELKLKMTSEDTLFFYFSGHGDFGYDSNGESSWSVATPHSYSNNDVRSFTTSASGADAIRIHFSRIELEEGFDFVLIGDENFDVYDVEWIGFEDFFLVHMKMSGLYGLCRIQLLYGLFQMKVIRIGVLQSIKSNHAD